MSRNDLRILIDAYLERARKNVAAIGDMINEGRITPVDLDSLTQIVDRATENLIARWRTGRKTIRTYVAMEMIHDYPEELLDLSMLIDAVINLLDDLLDEILDMEQKAMNIVELIRLFACLFQDPKLSRMVRRTIANYFNKILCIAGAEVIGKKLISDSDTLIDTIKHTIDTYDAKSLDME